MLKIEQFGNILTHEQMECLKKFSTAEICDGLSEFNVVRGGCMNASISPIGKNVCFAGVAYTVKAEDGNSLPVQYAIYNGSPGYVLVIDTGLYQDGPYLGELMALTAKKIGIEAIVIDGFVRDAEAIAQMGYPIFCKGFMPRKPSKTDIGEINQNIFCGGINVSAGDVIIGDKDGIVVIPRKILNDVLTISKKKCRIDHERKENINKFFDNNIFNHKKRNIETIMSNDVNILIKQHFNLNK